MTKDFKLMTATGMRVSGKFAGLVVALGLSFAGITSVPAVEVTRDAMAVAPEKEILTQVQYGGRRGRCENWRQQCANLYGWNTSRWQACMGQPQAVADCSGRRGYDDDDDNYGGRTSCSSWQQQCANLYGWRTERWHLCMGQPNAVRACR